MSLPRVSNSIDVLLHLKLLLSALCALTVWGLWQGGAEHPAPGDLADLALDDRGDAWYSFGEGDDAAALSMDPMQDADAFPGHLPDYRYVREVRYAALDSGLRESLLYAMIKAESGFRPGAASPDGATGLMQVVAHTAGREAHARLHRAPGMPSRDDLHDPETNLRYATTYLKILQHRYLGAVDDRGARTVLLLAAYNWGPTNVREKILARHHVRDRQSALAAVDAVAPRETRRYVRKVLAYQQEFFSLPSVN